MIFICVQYVKQVEFRYSPIPPTPPPSHLFHGTKCEKDTEEAPLIRGASILDGTKCDVSLDAGEFDDIIYVTIPTFPQSSSHFLKDSPLGDAKIYQYV